MVLPQTLIKIAFCIENLILASCSIGVISMAIYFISSRRYIHELHFDLSVLGIAGAIIVAAQAALADYAVLAGEAQAYALTCFMGTGIIFFGFYVALTVSSASKISELNISHVDKKLYNMLKSHKTGILMVEERYSCCVLESNQDWKDENWNEKNTMCNSNHKRSSCAEVISRNLKWATNIVYILGMVCSIVLPCAIVKAYVLLVIYDFSN